MIDNNQKGNLLPDNNQTEESYRAGTFMGFSIEELESANEELLASQADRLFLHGMDDGTHVPTHLHMALHDTEGRIVALLRKRKIPVQERLRQKIRELADEELGVLTKPLPAYVKLSIARAMNKKKREEEKKARETMSPEEYATTVLKGRVVGNKVYFMTPQMDVPIALDIIKEYDIDSDQLFITHINILNGTLIYPNGSQMAEVDRERIIKRWESIVE